MSIIPIYSWNPYRECVTVVIPTILMCPKEIFNYTLTEFTNCEVVKEIIIIDNTPDKRFDKEYTLTPKIKVVKPETNLGACVNDGMDLITTEYYLITNDDVACRGRIALCCFGIMEQDKEIGLIQVEQKVGQPLADYIKTPLKDTSYMFPPNPRACMTGWFHFGRTEEWEPIPTTLKYFYGDDLILDRMRLNKRKVARLANDHVSHHMSSSVQHRNHTPDTHLAIQTEGVIYRQLVKDLEKRINEKNSVK